MILVALVVALLALPASAHARITSFQTPSRNIHCAYVPDRDVGGPFIRCDVHSLEDRGVELRRTGRARLLRISDTVAHPRSAVLAYGRTRRFGAFSCTSRRSGLECRSASGHGFTATRERIRRFYRP